LKDGTRVPGTTTILGRFKAADGLIHWAWQCGRDGKDYRAERDTAANIGTVAHEMVEQFIAGSPASECEVLASKLSRDDAGKARSAFAAYQSWAANFRVRIIEREVQLVSEAYKYGGTPDAIGYVGNQTGLALLDWKSSNSVYADYLIQLAAYRQLWDENNPDRPIVAGFHLLRFAKTEGDFAHHYFPNLDEAWEQFKLFRQAYEIDKQLKKRAT